MNRDKIETIHESLTTGQWEEMVNQIDEYGSDFWSDYRDFLAEEYGAALLIDGDESWPWDYFTAATISYFRIKNR
jgi:hypothetical protein